MHERDEYAHKILVGNLKRRDHSEDLDGRITLGRILEKYDGKVWTGCIWLRIGVLVNTVKNLRVP
jgi:hypothetical protein